MGYKVKGKPWEYQGAINVSDCITSKEVIEKSGLNFEVAKCELVGKMPINFNGTDEELDKLAQEQKNGAHIHGQYIYRKCNNIFATYRTDYNIPLGVVKNKYTTVQNKEAFAFFDDAIGKNNAIWQTAGFWGNGERIFVSAKLPDTIFVKGDPVENYLVFTNSHDGTNGIKILFTPIRIACQNALNAAISSSNNYVSFRHTSSVHENISLAKEILGISKKYANNINDYYNMLADIKLTDTDVINYIGDNFLTTNELELLKATNHTVMEIIRRNNDAILDAKISMRKVNMMCDTFDYYFYGPGQKEILGTAWGAANAISGYYSNIDSVSGIKRMESILYSDKSKKINTALELAASL